MPVNKQVPLIPVAEFNRSKAKPHRPKKAVKSCKYKSSMELMLKLLNVPYVKEHKFHPKRRWLFDYAIIDKKIAIEYEGVFGGGKSRHTTVTGYTGDTEKYNEATLLGWKVLRYTAKNYTNLTDDLKALLKPQP